jgi:hypothetical protein
VEGEKGRERGIIKNILACVKGTETRKKKK